MSTGHGHSSGDIDIAPLSTAVMNRLIQDPRIANRLNSYHNINREYDLPFLGGYSQDGRTIYIDRHLPEQLSYELDGRTFSFCPDNFVCLHEVMEKACIDCLDWGYNHAHAAANGYEKRGVLAAGMLWSPYNKPYARYIKADEKEKLKKVPPDLDMTPYCTAPVDKALLARLQKVMGGEHADKKAKSDPEVNYGEGHPTSHCGWSFKWPRGVCAHYQEPHGCALVRGYIEPHGWCKLWERANAVSR